MLMVRLGCGDVEKETANIACLFIGGVCGFRNKADFDPIV